MTSNLFSLWKNCEREKDLVNLTWKSDDSDDDDYAGLGLVVQGADRMNNTAWCRCSNCNAMPSQLECKCCTEVAAVRRVVPNLEAGQCIISHLDFNIICLHKQVLRATIIMRNDVRGHVVNVPQGLENKTYRYAAYRMFTYWVHGKLGQGVRKVVPACAVSKIRETFPDPNGVYVGFQIGDDGVEVEVDEVQAV
ncbi:P2X purinoceptor 7 [Holothuria leucospilota]|uniref:P2X purinoceptor 7 n=1 Tax=Holothuria leucospilota TaxID=206669 RepID=A0A9Q1HJ48_HOLLE|nr:P2X purinoceptor 7 [Holothuria leucospilota]